MEKKRLLYVLFCLFDLYKSVQGDTFPSLLTTNATLAVVIDREYLADDFDKVKDSIEQYMIYAKREILRHGGVNVRFYTWTTINVKRDFTAILSVATCSDTWKLFGAVSEENLLHMAITESDCPRLPPEEAITVPIVKRGEEVPQIVLDLKMWKAFQWKSLVFLHDDSLHPDFVSRIITVFSTDTPDKKYTSTAVTILQLKYKLDDVNKQKVVYEQLAQLPLKQIGTNFLVFVSIHTVSMIMEIAKRLGMTNPKSQWLYVITDTDYKYDNISSFSSLLGEGENVAFVYNNTITKKNCETGIECYAKEMLKGFMIALDRAIINEMETSSKVPDEEWQAVRPTKFQRTSALQKAVKHHIKEFGTCNNCTGWKLKASETWGISFRESSKSLKPKILEVGFWRPSDGPDLRDELFPHIAHGFRGQVLPLVSFHNPPWQILKVNSTGAVVEYSGVVFDILDMISRSLNFSFTILFPGKERVGVSINESYEEYLNNMNVGDIHTITSISDNIIDIIKKKSVIMGACGFTINQQRKQVINFTTPISIQPYTFLVSRPKELSRALLFMSPFSYDTWLCLGFALTGMGPILFLIHKFSPVYEFKGIPKKGGLSTIQNCLWYMYGALMQQGGMYLPRADSGRLIVGTWWLVVLVIVTTYSGNLVAYLTFPKMEIPINNIHDLLKQEETVTWSILKGTFIEDHLKLSTENRFIQLFKRVILDEKVDTTMLDRVIAGKHVFIDWKTNLQFIMKSEFLRTNQCSLRLGTDEFLNEQIAMIVAIGNPYLPMLNEEIKRLHQMGFIEKWLKDYMPKKDKCWNFGIISEVKNHTVNMNDMQGCIFILLLGFSLGILVVIGEKILKRQKKSTENKIIKPFLT